MFERIKSFFVNTMQQELQKRGYEVDQETLNRALTNAPQLAQQIQAIWVSNDKDKMSKIYTAILNAAREAGTPTTTEETKVKTKRRQKET